MSETKQIKRYELDICDSWTCNASLWEEDSGDYVRFSDYEKEVKALEEKLSECISALEFYSDLLSQSKSMSHRVVIQDGGSKARETLRGLRDE